MSTSAYLVSFNTRRPQTFRSLTSSHLRNITDRLHCDTYCDGTPLAPHGRVATIVMYCEESDRGGATAFPGIDVVVQGRKGQALLFHYSGDPETAPADPSSWRAGGVVDSG